MQNKKFIKTFNLLVADENRARVFLSFGKAAFENQWGLTTESAADVYLVHGQLHSNGLSQASQAVVVTVIAEGDSTSPRTRHVLHSPFQLEEFVAIVKTIEREIETHPAFLPTMNDPILEEQTAAEKYSDFRVNLAQPENTGSIVDQTRLPPNRLYKLKKWPSRNLMLKNPANHKIAIFLMDRKGVLLDDLSRLSGVSKIRCQIFLIDLLDNGILESKSPETVKPVLNGTGTTSPEKVRIQQNNEERATYAGPERRSLVSRVRRRLGIGYKKV